MPYVDCRMARGCAAEVSSRGNRDSVFLRAGAAPAASSPHGSKSAASHEEDVTTSIVAHNAFTFGFTPSRTMDSTYKGSVVIQGPR